MGPVKRSIFSLNSPKVCQNPLSASAGNTAQGSPDGRWFNWLLFWNSRRERSENLELCAQCALSPSLYNNALRRRISTTQMLFMHTPRLNEDRKRSRTDKSLILHQRSDLMLLLTWVFDVTGVEDSVCRCLRSHTLITQSTSLAFKAFHLATCQTSSFQFVSKRASRNENKQDA